MLTYLVLTFVIGLLLPLVIKPILTRLGAFDQVSDRSMHRRITIRGLGIVPVTAYSFGLLVNRQILEGDIGALPWAFLLLTGLAFGVLGSIEDLKGLQISRRLVSQLVIALIALLILPRDSGASWLISTLITIFAVFFIVAMVNIANFMDGVNGISGFHGVIFGLSFSCFGYLYDVQALVWAGLVLFVAFLAFIPWNYVAGGAFLGDSGSYLLGAVSSSLVILGVYFGVPILLAASPLYIYILDSTYTLGKRIVKRESWLSPHREHIYQQLAIKRFSHTSTSCLVASFTLTSVLIGVLGTVGFLKTAPAAIFVSYIVLGIIYLALPRLVIKPS